MTLQLIVKGNASEARVACDYNGITVISAIGHPRVTIIRADDKFEYDAQKWFVASGIYDDRKPAPIGTLMWYGTVADKETARVQTLLHSGDLFTWPRRHGHDGLFSRDCDQCIEDGS